MNFSQYNFPETKNACGIVTYLNILKYSYAINYTPTFVVKSAIFFDKLWIFSILWWALFDVLYKWITKSINTQTWLNFKVVTTQISKLRKTDTKSYWIWIKKYWTVKWNKISDDGIITKKEIDYLKSKNLGVWHNAMWDWNWYFKDTNWNKAIKFSLDNLKYAQSLDLMRDNIRTIVPNDEKTKEVCHLCIRLFQAEKKGRLDAFIDMNKNNKYLAKAVELYNIWKD